MPLLSTLMKTMDRPDPTALAVKRRVSTQLTADERIVNTTRVESADDREAGVVARKADGLPSSAWMVCTDRRLFFVEHRAKTEMPVVPFESVARFEVSSRYGADERIELALHDGRSSRWAFTTADGSDLASVAEEYRIGRRR